MSGLSRLIAALTTTAILLGSGLAAQAASGSGCFQVVNVAYNDVLNMRSGPSPRSGIVGVLAPGGHGIISRSGPCIPSNRAWSKRWCPVTHYSGNGTTTGWVKARFVRVSACP